MTKGLEMSRNRWIWLAVAAVVVVAVIVVIFVASGKSPLPLGTTPGNTAAVQPAGATGTNPPSASAKNVSNTDQATNKLPPAATKGDEKTSSVNAPGDLTPFPPLPESKIAAEDLKSPLATGEPLPPLLSAPDHTIFALKLGQVYSRQTFSAVLSPYGIGPSSTYGSRIVVKVESAKSLGTANSQVNLANSNLLVIVDTNEGGTISSGGTYTGTITWRSDGTKMLPILSNVQPKS